MTNNINNGNGNWEGGTWHGGRQGDIPTIFVGLALSDSMFGDDVGRLRRQPLAVSELKNLLESYPRIVPCVNPSHKASLDALQQRFGISVPIPNSPPKVLLKPNDSLVVMQIIGLPRLTDRHEYTREEISKAEFRFTLYTARA